MPRKGGHGLQGGEQVVARCGGLKSERAARPLQGAQGGRRAGDLRRVRVRRDLRLNHVGRTVRVARHRPPCCTGTGRPARACLRDRRGRASSRRRPVRRRSAPARRALSCSCHSSACHRTTSRHRGAVRSRSTPLSSCAPSPGEPSRSRQRARGHGRSTSHHRRPWSLFSARVRDARFCRKGAGGHARRGGNQQILRCDARLRVRRRGTQVIEQAQAPAFTSSSGTPADKKGEGGIRAVAGIALRPGKAGKAAVRVLLRAQPLQAPLSLPVAHLPPPLPERARAALPGMPPRCPAQSPPAVCIASIAHSLSHTMPDWNVTPVPRRQKTPAPGTSRNGGRGAHASRMMVRGLPCPFPLARRVTTSSHGGRPGSRHRQIAGSPLRDSAGFTPDFPQTHDCSVCVPRARSSPAHDAIIPRCLPYCKCRAIPCPVIVGISPNERVPRDSDGYGLAGW